MSIRSFNELIGRLEDELHRLHYTEGTIKVYRRAWKHIGLFLEQEGLDSYTLVLHKFSGFSSKQRWL